MGFLNDSPNNHDDLPPARLRIDFERQRALALSTLGLPVGIVSCWSLDFETS